MDQSGVVVAFPLPLQGHINPMLVLCNAIADQGLPVVFVNAKSNHERLMAATSAKLNPSIRFASIPDNLHTPIAALDVHSNLTVFRNAVEAMRGDFERVLQGLDQPVRCIITEISVMWMQECAENFRVPRCLLFSESAASLMIHCHIPQLLANAHIPVLQGSVDEEITYLPGFPVISTADLPYTFSASAEKFDPGFSKRVQRVASMKKASCILVNSFASLEPSIFGSLQKEHNIVPVGPLLPPLDAAEGDQDAGLSWLDKQQKESVIYVAFGSNARLSMERFREICMGLCSSKHRSLWVLRPTLVPNSTISELLQVLHQGCSDNEQVFTVPWAPQVKVLSHPAVGCFFTHCGWNSTLESIRAGVPMVCLPLQAEQNLNSKFIADVWQIGARVAEVEHGHVEAVVSRVMEDVEMKNRVQDLAKSSNSSSLVRILIHALAKYC